MKKAILAILFIVPVLLSCNNNSNPLVGTKWVNVTPHPQEDFKAIYFTFGDTHVEAEYILINPEENCKYSTPYSFVAPNQIILIHEGYGESIYEYTGKKIIVPMPEFDTTITFERVKKKGNKNPKPSK